MCVAKGEPGRVLVSDGWRQRASLWPVKACSAALLWAEAVLLFSHLSAHLSQQFSGSLDGLSASTHASSMGSRRLRMLLVSLPTVCTCFSNNAHCSSIWALQASCWGGQQRKKLSALPPLLSQRSHRQCLQSRSPCPCQAGQASA